MNTQPIDYHQKYIDYYYYREYWWMYLLLMSRKYYPLMMSKFNNWSNTTLYRTVKYKPFGMQEYKAVNSGGMK